MKVKVSEATKNQLNWMVAVVFVTDACIFRIVNGEVFDRLGLVWRPTTDWSQGGPIIETKIDCLRKRSKAEEASLAHPNPNFKFKAEIFADIDGYFCAFGPTPLIAAMRCYVASKLGEEVEVPNELA